MAETEKSRLRLEIAHVLFIDIVGYSKLRINDQSEQIQKLREIVRGTEQFRSAEAEGKLLRLPTGDGGALVFRNNPEAPVLCALEIAKALKGHPELRVRMGIHSGPVNEVTDLNEQANIAGAGINIAQRIMDCGDAGHILVSKHAAEDLEQYDQWEPYLHDLGQCEVKHGERLQVVNLYTVELGNPARPTKFQHAARTDDVVTKTRKLSPALIVILSLIALAIVSVIFAPAIMKVAIPRSREAVRSSAGEDGRRSAPSLPVTEKSIAVLPFENLSRDPDNAYFADGIQDEILTRLSKVAALKVISRTSTQKYKSAPDNLREVGKQLGVANLLEGSVQKIANAVHINVQLIRAGTDEHLWAESYNRKLDDVFGVEAEVASAIAEQLNAKLSGAEAKAIADKPTQNAAAYDTYLRGISLESAGSTDAFKATAAAYAEAVRLDPKFGVAWARLAIARSHLYFNGIDPAANSAAAVKDAADHALALQPEAGETWVAQGVYRYRILRDFPAALKSYEEALKRLPNSSLVLEEIGHLERRLGQLDAAEKHYQAAAQLDPRSFGILSTLADLLQSLRRFKEAEAVLDRVLQISPGNENALTTKAFGFQGQGRLDESAKALSDIPANSKDDGVALAKSLQLFYERRFDAAITELQQAPSVLADDPRSITLLGYCQEFAGHKDEARAAFDRAVAAMKPSPASVVAVDARQLPAFLAWAYAGLGEKTKALEQARQAVSDYQADVLSKPFAEQVLAEIQARFGDADSAIAALPHLLEVPNGITPGLLRIDPLWDPLRKDPRFEKLCQEQQH